MSDYADEMDARGQDHDLTTGDPAPNVFDWMKATRPPYTRLATVMLYGGDTDDLF